MRAARPAKQLKRASGNRASGCRRALKLDLSAAEARRIALTAQIR